MGLAPGSPAPRPQILKPFAKNEVPEPLLPEECSNQCLQGRSRLFPTIKRGIRYPKLVHKTLYPKDPGSVTHSLSCHRLGPRVSARSLFSGLTARGVVQDILPVLGRSQTVVTPALLIIRLDTGVKLPGRKSSELVHDGVLRRVDIAVVGVTLLSTSSLPSPEPHTLNP